MDDPILEELVEKALEPLGKVVATPAGVAQGDAVENFPDGDGSETNALVGNRIEKGGDTRFGSRTHHLRHDVGIEEPRQRLGHALSSSANEIGL